jgi:signal transduction histidine kinase
VGLALARRIVTDHGGTISFDSTPDGSVVAVTLPVASTQPRG